MTERTSHSLRGRSTGNVTPKKKVKQYRVYPREHRRGYTELQLRPWVSGRTLPSPLQIPGECMCVWVPTHGVWELKFSYAMCPYGDHGHLINAYTS